MQTNVQLTGVLCQETCTADWTLQIGAQFYPLGDLPSTHVRVLINQTRRRVFIAPYQPDIVICVPETALLPKDGEDTTPMMELMRHLVVDAVLVDEIAAVRGFFRLPASSLPSDPPRHSLLAQFQRGAHGGRLDALRRDFEIRGRLRDGTLTVELDHPKLRVLGFCGMPGDPRGTEPFIHQAYRFAALLFDISSGEAAEAVGQLTEDEDGMKQVARIAAKTTFMWSTDGLVLVHGKEPASIEQQVRHRIWHFVLVPEDDGGEGTRNRHRVKHDRPKSM